MTELKALAEKVVAFREERDWKQFHNPKDLALSLVLESAELLEIFQWKDAAATQQVASTHKAALSDELADVLYYVLLMAHDLEIDLPQALVAKLAKNAEKYPLERAKGSNKKYTEL
jgi:NTP pyrophosphatase (non-canonical NTP hydrolase)